VCYSNFVPETHRFWDIQLQKCYDLEIRVRGHSRSSELTRINPPPTTSYERYIATIGLSRTVSEINGDFSRKLHFFLPYVRVLRPRSKGSLWNWIPTQGVKKLEWYGATRWSKSFKICIRLDIILECDGRTDGQTRTRTTANTAL